MAQHGTILGQYMAVQKPFQGHLEARRGNFGLKNKKHWISLRFFIVQIRKRHFSFSFWSFLEPNLRPFWANRRPFGPTLAILARPWSFLGQFWAIQRPFWGYLEPGWASFRVKSKKHWFSSGFYVVQSRKRRFPRGFGGSQEFGNIPGWGLTTTFGVPTLARFNN